MRGMSVGVLLSTCRFKPWSSRILLLAGATSLLGCGGSWEVKKTGVARQPAGTVQVVTVERAEGRRSPWIKTFGHLDLGVFKESAGSRHNTAFAPGRVETSPGTMRVGVVLPENVRVYYPEVEFTAAAGRRYWLTWMCVPYPIVAIVDAGSTRIVATDSYCPECAQLNGRPLTSESECLEFMHPPWMSPDEDKHWLPWYLEWIAQTYRNLCAAAEAGVGAAASRLGELYLSGIYGAPKDRVRSYVWYRVAADAGHEQSGKMLEAMRRDGLLSTEKLADARRLSAQWHPGQCERELLGATESRYELRVGAQ